MPGCVSCQSQYQHANVGVVAACWFSSLIDFLTFYMGIYKNKIEFYYILKDDKFYQIHNHSRHNGGIPIVSHRKFHTVVLHGADNNLSVINFSGI